MPNAAKINKFLEKNVVQNCDNGLTIHPHVACFFPTETPQSDSAKNMHPKDIRGFLLSVNSLNIATTQTNDGF